MERRTLDEWLEWQLEHHPTEIDLGLDRVRTVASNLDLLSPSYRLVTVAGTNGKGSSVAMLESILRHAGFTTGTYTSPHLHHYNERIKLSGIPVADDLLCTAFEAIDDARDQISLSFFEWGTLASMWVLKEAEVDVGILEVGLGGRLDAVNILDADVMLVTSIGIDHTDWLGDTRELISLEKFGIGRKDRPMICSEPDLPEIFIDTAKEKGIPLTRLGSEYDYHRDKTVWDWKKGNVILDNLPIPHLVGEHQIQNASGVIAVLDELEGIENISSSIVKGLQSVVLEGRFERAVSDPRIVFDVAHNMDSVATMVASLRAEPLDGRTLCLMGVLNDKDIKGMIEQMDGAVDHWFVSEPDSPRALATQDLFDVIRSTVNAETKVRSFTTLAEGLEAAKQSMGAQDRLLVTGSFFTVAQVRELVSTEFVAATNDRVVTTQ